jgi:hypothetical protein
VKEKVMIGCPVRNRGWILPDYLQHLQNIKYPRSLIEYCFIINDCIDNTREILEEFAQNTLTPVRLITANLGNKQSDLRGVYNLSNLALLRNLLLEEFIESDCQYLLSVDSDILVPPNIISRLIADNCAIVSALVCNGHELKNKSIYNILLRTRDGKYKHFIDYPHNCLFKIDCTGAAYLIKRKVIESYKIRYSAHSGAEDIGFCEAAARQGLEIYCDSRIECVHIMNKEQYLKQPKINVLL